MYNNSKSLSDLITMAEENKATQVVKNGSSKYSFSIVNAHKNSKRLSFSKQLTTDIGLEDEVYILPSVASNELFVTSATISDKCSKGTLSGDDGKKICYSTPLVKLIVETFKVNFDGHTSKAFNDISIDDVNGVKVARIQFEQPNSNVQANDGGEE